MTTSRSAGSPATSSRELGDRVADANVTVYQSGGTSGKPAVQVRPPFGHANSTDNVLDPGPSRGDRPDDVGMEQKGLHNVGLPLSEQPRESADDGGRLQHRAGAEEFGVDTGGGKFTRRASEGGLGGGASGTTIGREAPR